MIPREEIDQVRAAADIVELVRARGVELRQVGTRQVGLCPFHAERTGSFNVNAATNTYRCFGCGEKGDVFSFIMAMDGLPFIDAVRSLAEMYSITLHETQTEEDKDASSRRRLYVVVAEAAAWLRQNFAPLPSTHPAKAELAKRNLLEVEGHPNWLEEFGVGYAPEGWSHLSDHLLKQGFTTDEIVQAGLATVSQRGTLVDRFRGRLTWEIRDIQGRPIGFGARRLFDSDDGPKYLNSPQGLLYDKSRVLYGLDLSRKYIASQKEVVVVEGYTDVMAMHAAGVRNVVASSGTAFGEHHATILRRLIDDFDGIHQGTFVFGFDGDAAGQKAAQKTFSLKAPIHTRSFVISGEGDPCDLRLARGDDALREMVAAPNRVPLTDFVLKGELSKHDISTSEGRNNFLRVAVTMLSVITDMQLREDYARKVSFWSGTSIDVVKDAVRQAHRFSPDAAVNEAAPALVEPAPDDAPPPPEDDPFAEPPADMYEPEQAPESQNQKSDLWQHEFTVLALMMQYPRAAWAAVKDSGLTDRDFPDAELMHLFVELSAVLTFLTSQEEDFVLTPRDFGNEDIALDLLHHRLPVIEKMYDKAGGDEFVTRTTARFAQALKAIPERDKQRALKARVAVAYSDRSTEDASALTEILEAQKALSQSRRRRPVRPTR